MRLTSFDTCEEVRLNDLYTYNILDTEEEKEFNDLVELVDELYNCAIVSVTFVDKSRLWFKALKGAEAKEVPREGTPCHYAIRGNEVMTVPDLLSDERFADNQLLTETMGMRFYAGAPIISTDGNALGTVCIFDNRPRRMSQKQCFALKAIASQVSRLLELKAKNRLIRQQANEMLQAEKNFSHGILQEQEKERLSIGTELHENIAQGLAATKLYLELVGQSVEHPFLQKSAETVTQLLGQVKDLSHSIVPTTLQSAGLKSLLQILVRRYQDKHGFDVDFEFSGGDVSAPELAVAIYRMVEETFENVLRHAKAKHITLQVKNSDSRINLSIADNGVGINLQHFKKGAGLGAVVAITEHYGGTVDLISDKDQGCKLLLQLPIKEQSR